MRRLEAVTGKAMYRHSQTWGWQVVVKVAARGLLERNSGPDVRAWARS